MADIKRILRKRRWTGRELGILELYEMCELYRQDLEGIAEPKHIVEPDRFRQMLDTVRGTEAGKDYNGYLAIYEWLRLHNYIALAHEQQAQLQIISMHNDLTNATIAETLFSYIDELPMIVTEKQYNDMRAEARENELTGKHDNLFALVERGLSYYAQRLRENPRDKDNPLRALKVKLQRTPATSSFVLSAYQEPPEISLWDELTDLTEYYQHAAYTLQGEPEEAEAVEEVKDFLIYFHEAADAVLKDIEEKGLISGISLRDLPAERWIEPRISWRELYERDIYGMRALVDADTTLFDGNKRAIFNGIAIVRSSDLLQSSRIDGRGYYKPPQFADGVKPLSLEAYFADDEAGKKKRRDRAKYWQALRDSYALLLGFNKALELIAEAFDIEPIKVFRIDIESMQKNIEEVNELRNALELMLTETHAGDYFLKQKKVEVLREVFPPFDISGIQIPERNIAAARELMKDYKAFREGADAFRALLFYAGSGDQSEAGEEGAHD